MKNNFLKKLFTVLIAFSAGFACCMGGTEKGDDVVNFYGWGGSMLTNRWIDGTLSDIAQETYGIKVNRVGMDIDDILNLLIAEKAAGKQDGSVDLVWINGENFYTAMQADLLYGSITDKVPNFKTTSMKPHRMFYMTSVKKLTAMKFRTEKLNLCSYTIQVKSAKLRGIIGSF